MDRKIVLTLYNICSKYTMLGSMMDYICSRLPTLVIIIYIFGAISLLFKDFNAIGVYLGAPALTLAVVTIIRKLVNRPRPFDSILEIVPRVKHGSGDSFPSRHMASSCIIAFAMGYINSYLQLVCFLLAVLIGLSRVFTGVHYLSDVLAGAGISIIFGITFF